MAWRKVAFLLILAGGCGPVRVSRPAPCPSQPAWDGQHWPRVLSRFVSAEGQVDFKGLKADGDDLVNFVRQLGCHGPETRPGEFSDAGSRLAYWVNAHNAVALAGAVQEYPAKRLGGDFDRRVSAWVDGRVLTLGQMADLARAAGGGDPRVDLALVQPAKGSGKMFGKPFEPQDTEVQLSEHLARALGDPAMVKIDHERWTLFLGEPIWRHRKDYVRQYRETFHTDSGGIVNALAMHADDLMRGRLESAVGYRVARLVYDGTINEWDRFHCSVQ